MQKKNTHTHTHIHTRFPFTKESVTCLMSHAIVQGEKTHSYFAFISKFYLFEKKKGCTRYKKSNSMSSLKKREVFLYVMYYVQRKKKLYRVTSKPTRVLSNGYDYHIY